MIRKALLALALCVVSSTAFAQTCPTRPVGDSSNSCASTQFVQQNIANSTRPKLLANLSLYYKLGSTSTTCTGNSTSGACPSPAAAIAAAYLYDRNGHTITIQPLTDGSSAGTYSPFVLSGAFIGSGSTIVQGYCGSSATWPNVVISGTNQTAILATEYASAVVQCLKVTTTSAGDGLGSTIFSELSPNNIVFGPIAGAAFDAYNYGKITNVGSTSNFIFTANIGTDVIHANEGGIINLEGAVTFTCNGISTVTGDTVGSAKTVYIPNLTNTGCGSVTNLGNSHQVFVHNWGTVNAGGSGATNYFFGSGGISTTYGGFYDYGFAAGQGWQVYCPSSTTNCPLYVFGSLIQVQSSNPGATNAFSVVNTGITNNTGGQWVLNTNTGGNTHQFFGSLVENGSNVATAILESGLGVTNLNIIANDPTAPINLSFGGIPYVQGGADGGVRPFNNGTQTLGDSTHRWSNVYSGSLNVQGNAVAGTMAVGGCTIGSNILCSAGTAGFNFITLTHATGLGTAPTCSSGGIGSTGACALSTGSNDTDGVITLTPSGTGIGTFGNLTLTLNATLGTNGAACPTQFLNGTGTWSAPVMIALGATTNAPVFQWYNNNITLTSGSTYKIIYHCLGF